jgi:cobalt/nickel transport protein
MNRSRFYVGFLLVALVLAGLVSYLASRDPDGLDTVAQHGCQVGEVDGIERLTGTCIARSATKPATAGSPLADYTVGGSPALGGVAGVIGVLVTLALGGGLFWLLRGRGRARPEGQPVPDAPAGGAPPEA